MGGRPQSFGRAQMSLKKQYGEISLTLNGHVAVLEIDRPPHNFLSVQLMRDLGDALEALDADAICRSVVLCSAGKNFSAGADFSPDERVEILTTDAGQTNPLYAQAVRLFACKKPIVAAVQGSAVGAGLGLALVADFRVAATSARFTANFVKLGFHPGLGVTATLPRLIGGQRAALMCLTGRPAKGGEALSWGLVDELVPLEELRLAAVTLAAEIAGNAPLAVQSTRGTMRGGLAAAVKAQTDKEAAQQEWLRDTTDFAEGIRAVAERRSGNFTGR